MATVLKVRDWAAGEAVKRKQLDAATQDRLEMMLLHWLRCLPEFDGVLHDAITVSVDVEVFVDVAMPWCEDQHKLQAPSPQKD